MAGGEQIEDRGLEEILFKTLSLHAKEMKDLQHSLDTYMLGLWPFLCIPKDFSTPSGQLSCGGSHPFNRRRHLSATLVSGTLPAHQR